MHACSHRRMDAAGTTRSLERRVHLHAGTQREPTEDTEVSAARTYVTTFSV